MGTEQYDVIVVGGGIVGLATAHALLQRYPGLPLLLVEKEDQLASHQTGHNSGVIHSGIYYRPGSLKAALCVAGGRLLMDFCDAHQIPYQRCGKVIVAVDSSELATLELLHQQGVANHVPGLCRIGPERLRELEPHVRGVHALHLPQVAIVDFVAVAQALAQDIGRFGGVIHTSTPVRRVHRGTSVWQLDTTDGVRRARVLINCGGLHADRLGRMAGDRPSVQIIPFRGEYYTVPPSRYSLVNGVVYPVPNPSLPFLGVHFTKMLTGGVHVGPNAVLALKREGYRRREVSWRDCLGLATSVGFWRMAARHWHIGAAEWFRAASPRAFLRAAQRLVPSLTEEDLLPSPAGVRAQAVDRNGTLLDDFIIQESAQALHVYNAPSPAATASLSIGQAIADRAADLIRRRDAA